MTLRRGAALAAFAAAALAGCGKGAPPAADAAAEQAEATERARHDPYGAEVKALDAAKAMEADVNAKAGAKVDEIEKNAK